MRRLPVLAERSVAEVKALQIEADQRFHRTMVHGGARTTCTKGCAHCCRHPFLISVAEGVLLYRWLQETNKWSAVLRKRLEETRDKVMGLAFEVWLLSDLACPLLHTDDTCLAYGARPTRCRILYSTGLPSLCRPTELGVATPLLPYADYIIGFTLRSQAALKKAGVKEGHLMPLAEAVLLGEAIDTGRLSLQDTDTQHMRDLLNG